RIEIDEAAGELGALLREARLVKDLLPLHNHRLRRKRNACFLRLPDLRSPPEILANADIDWLDYMTARSSTTTQAGAETLFGPFATRQHVKQMLEGLAHEHGLCWRQLGWEKRGGPCFARQVRRCKGACIGEESPEQHHLRLATALSKHKLRDWPWHGRVLIRERHPEGRFEEAHVFDRWCHVGTARGDDTLDDLLHARVELEFDPDIYKIVASYIDKHPGRVCSFGRSGRYERPPP
ncbi:MAG: hypothetical protein ACM3X5_03185, partial [Bacillota bacterium]